MIFYKFSLLILSAAVLSISSCYISVKKPFLPDNRCKTDSRLKGKWVTKINPEGSKLIHIKEQKNRLIIQTHDPSSSEKVIENFGHAITCTMDGTDLMFVSIDNGIRDRKQLYMPVAYETGKDYFDIIFFKKDVFEKACTSGELSCEKDSAGLSILSGSDVILNFIRKTGIKNSLNRENRTSFIKKSDDID